MQEEIKIIQQWLKDMSASVQAQDLKRHMSLVSKRVHVYGLPNKDTINHTQWQQRRRNEFQTDRLIAMQHGPVKIKILGLVRVSFNVEQTIISKEGFVYIINKDIMLEKEEDGIWRVVEETIHHWKQKQYQLAAGEHE